MGIMRSWNAERGFGFIRPTTASTAVLDNLGNDIFCHVAEIEQGQATMKNGTNVEFSVVLDERRGTGNLRAVQVRQVILSFSLH